MTVARNATFRLKRSSLATHSVALLRLELGIKLKPIVPPMDYEPIEVHPDNHEGRHGDADQNRFPGIPDDPAECEAYLRQVHGRREAVGAS